MAKRMSAKQRKYFGKRTIRRTTANKTVTRRRSRSKTFGIDTSKMLGAGLYGALRERMSKALDPITQKIPFGTLSDEALMLVTNYFISKGKIPVLNKVPLTRDFGNAGVLIESARIGQVLASGGFGGMMNTGTKTVSDNRYSF